MNKRTLLLVPLLLAALAGCNRESASPTPSPTPTPEAATAVPPAGLGVCRSVVAETDHARGPADASIIVIVYSDFQ